MANSLMNPFYLMLTDDEQDLMQSLYEIGELIPEGKWLEPANNLIHLGLARVRQDGLPPPHEIKLTEYGCSIAKQISETKHRREKK